MPDTATTSSTPDDPALFAILVVSAIVAVFALVLGVLAVVAVRERRRRRRRAENGTRASAVVDGVEPLRPPESGRAEHPFWLHFAGPQGDEQRQRFTEGFGGIVPVEGWQVTVLFESDDPGNIEITDNPHRHGLPGAAPASPRGRRLVAVLFVCVAATVLVPAVLAFMTFARSGVEGHLFTGIGLTTGAVSIAVAGIGVAMLVGAVGRRRRATVATGAVTHTWRETRRTSGTSDGPSRTRTVHPFTVRFALPDGRHVHRRAHETPDRDRLRPGQSIEVAFDPAQPTSFTTGPTWRTLAPSVAFTVIWVLVGGILSTVFVVLGLAE